MKKFLVNERIRAHRVKLILPNGDNQGEMLKSAALDMARREGLDLVEFSPGIIPVCKIADYGKMMYDQSKQQKHQHAPALKEIKFKYMTGNHDLEIKRKKAVELLENGHKVLFVMEVRGREKYIVGNAAKERFNSIVKEYFAAYKLSDTQDSGGNSYRITVLPIKG